MKTNTQDGRCPISPPLCPTQNKKLENVKHASFPPPRKAQWKVCYRTAAYAR